MKIIKINPDLPSLETIEIAAEIIKKGGIIIYPTDTIYGIGASALSQEAIDKIYRIKERPSDKPLSVVVKDLKMAKVYCCLGKIQEEIFKALLPGAFTLILPIKKSTGRNNRFLGQATDLTGQEKILTDFKNTLSIRIPDFKITAYLAKKLKIPFTATSANISGLPGSGDIKQILKQLENKKNQIDLVLDAGVLPGKKSSTIIDLTEEKPKIIRK